VDGSVTIDNDGDLAATGLRIALTGPPGGRIEDVSSGCAAGTAITCELPSLAAQGRTTVSFRVHVPATSGPATTSIVVGATEHDPDPTTNTLVLRTSVLPCTIVGTSGADWLRGTPEPDRICGLPGSDRLLGLAGDDYLDAGNGDDEIVGGPGRDTIVARGGRDLIRTRDGQRDRIDCGSERDIVLADRFDQLLGGCDYVLTNGLRCTKFGTGGGDTLTGTSRRDVICALPGNDTVRGGAGDDALDGGNGNDTLDGGPGRDLVLGGPGFDTISSRDGARDRIRCGTGDDLVLADRRDDVASDCELLRRG
jgi:Ca2+-binding RTX toxin-like protein